MLQTSANKSDASGYWGQIKSMFTKIYNEEHSLTGAIEVEPAALVRLLTSCELW